MRVVLAGICLVLCLAVSRINGDVIACDPATRPRVLTELTGDFMSPNFPGNYPSNATCQWRIVAQPGHVVRVDFTAFNTEHGIDVVWFFDGDSYLSPAITGLSGDRNPPPTMIANTNMNMYIEFTSNANAGVPGFSATYWSVHQSEITGSCNAVSRPEMLTGDTGMFTSPFFPDMYPFLCECQWQITSSMPNGRVQLDFTVFNTQANSDWVRIFDGTTETDSLIARIGGVWQPPPTGFFTTQQKMLVIFNADEQISFQGFSATYTSLGSAQLNV